MYNPNEVESRWQKIWEENQTYKFNPDSPKDKYYCLVMFPYPSGKIHMGHVRNYVIGDVFARYYRLKNYEVFHPIGWDSFGLPAENAAIKNGIHPQEWTQSNIAHMKKQLRMLGISYDWSAEITTSNPEYYKWNQWFFLKMYESGLVYKKKSEVNWCPKCETVLANEQVISGVCWRCETTIEKKELEQWFIKITEFAEELLSGHEQLKNHWPDEVLNMQKNWLGRSEGAEVYFKIANSDESILIFTTRPDTLFGATFVTVSPEHPLSKKLAEHNSDIRSYIERCKKKTLTEKISLEKTGVFSGLFTINPVNSEKIPIWISDYVTMEYGTGAIMCVPAHDQRDFEFAKKYNLPIKQVIQPPSNICYPIDSAYEGDGIMINSGDFSGLDNKTGAKKIVESLVNQNLAKIKINWRLKDWLISRQRYWGTPIPVVYCDKCGIQPVKYEELPVVLPQEVEITGRGDSPLKTNKEFLETSCPKCGGTAQRETDTMDTFVDSSWYYARYCDPHNSSEPFDVEKTNRLLPVEQYIGGIEHACMHLIYARFWHKFMKKIGLVNSDEPFKNLLTQGMVTLHGETMSKSKGNIVEPDTIVEKYGADTLRVFILFAAPPEKQLDWSDEAVEGARRFLNRVWRVVEKFKTADGDSTSEDKSKADELLKITAKTVHKVTNDIEKEKQFNTAIAAIMELLNFLTSYKNLGDTASRKAIESLLITLSPFAPHISEELYTKITNNAITKWPEFSEELLIESETEIAIQINGKLKGHLKIHPDTPESTIYKMILSDKNLSKYITDRKVKKFIYVPKKLVSISVE